MQIPFDQISDDALQGLVEEYVTREGTDYGHQEYSLAEKVAGVKRLLESGEAVIHFDTHMQTCTIVNKQVSRDLVKQSGGDPGGHSGHSDDCDIC
ncbi:YheU family protein [Motiliproteus sp. MSK22-1]|uniref:YheU family protein n=1 Tax=Motiliproteus sp. MSK22-1 TaxID=1897630 RepID=UPI00097659D7|nr:YheU family protein [Motiliproteus sp. MSK22-1]OMH30069.1 hypothetical protein BGP75_19255 [Motiliproteus sp. MSK22-1]